VLLCPEQCDVVFDAAVVRVHAVHQPAHTRVTLKYLYLEIGNKVVLWLRVAAPAEILTAEQTNSDHHTNTYLAL
jgi:hypothetical protein